MKLEDSYNSVLHFTTLCLIISNAGARGFILPDHRVKPGCQDSLKCPQHVSHPWPHLPCAQVGTITQQCVSILFAKVGFQLGETAAILSCL